MLLLKTYNLSILLSNENANGQKPRISNRTHKLINTDTFNCFIVSDDRCTNRNRKSENQKSYYVGETINFDSGIISTKYIGVLIRIQYPAQYACQAEEK